MDIRKVVGKRIKDARVAKKMKRITLAGMFDVAENTIYSWERGDYAPNLVNLERISMILDVPLPELVGGTTENIQSDNDRFMGILFDMYRQTRNEIYLDEIEKELERKKGN